MNKSLKEKTGKKSIQTNKKTKNNKKSSDTNALNYTKRQKISHEKSLQLEQIDKKRLEYDKPLQLEKVSDNKISYQSRLFLVNKKSLKLNHQNVQKIEHANTYKLMGGTLRQIDGRRRVEAIAHKEAKRLENEAKQCLTHGSKPSCADKEELLLVLDENGKSTGKLELRSVCHEKNLFHNEVALWVVDPKSREVLLQRRSPNKKNNPNCLGLCAGHVIENNSIYETLKSEFFEELGLDIEDYSPILLKVLKRECKNNNHFSYQYCIYERIPLEKIKIQVEELSEVLYMPLENLEKLYFEGSPEIVFKSPQYAEIFDIIKAHCDAEGKIKN